MTHQIQQARMLSAKVRRLLEAKQEVGELLYVKLRGDLFFEDPLKELLARLEGKILAKRVEIERIISSIPGYNRSIHQRIDYISMPDLRAGTIDLSLDFSGKYKLDLETGNISEALGSESTEEK